MASARSASWSSRLSAQALAPGFFREHNPVVRHTVLRRRQTLEEAGLLERVGVDVHPDPDAPATAYPGVGFNGLGLLTNHPFDLAYQAAEAFTTALKKRTKAAGLHEDAAAAAHLLELRLRALRRRRRCSDASALEDEEAGRSSWTTP